MLHLTQCQEENIQISKGFLMLNPQYVKIKFYAVRYTYSPEIHSEKVQILLLRVEKHVKFTMLVSRSKETQNFVEFEMTDE